MTALPMEVDRSLQHLSVESEKTPLPLLDEKLLNKSREKGFKVVH